MFVCFHAGFSHRWVLSNHTLFSCSFPDPQQQKVHDRMSRRRQNMSDDALKTRSLDVRVRCTQQSHWGGSRHGPESSVCPQLCVHVCMWGCVHVCGRPCVYIFVQHILLSSEHCGAERTSSPGLWSNCPRQSACWEPFWVRRICVCMCVYFKSTSMDYNGGVKHMASGQKRHTWGFNLGRRKPDFKIRPVIIVRCSSNAGQQRLTPLEHKKKTLIVMLCQ